MAEEKSGEANTPEGGAPTLLEGLQRLMLASIGAVAISRDETEGFVNRLVERGQIAQKDAERVMNEFRERVRQGNPQVAKVEDQVENGVEQFLNRLNIPSKRDIDELTSQLAQLSARVEALRKTQDK